MKNNEFMKIDELKRIAEENDYELSECPSLGVSTQFTLKEIEEIKERFDTDLSDFEMVEVEE